MKVKACVIDLVDEDREMNTKEQACPFCAYPVLVDEQRVCSECGERVNGDEAWMRRRERELVWDRYRWVLITGVLGATSTTAVVIHRFINVEWVLIMLIMIFAISMVLGMFIIYRWVQLLIIALIAALTLILLEKSDVSNVWYLIVMQIIVTGINGGFVLVAVTCGAVLRELCWSQCKRDLGG